MVALVSGNGLGLMGSSKSVLGQNGQIGTESLGQAGGQIDVNTRTGNLIIQQLDEILIGCGPDAQLVRTYNSAATFDFDNNDGWQLSLYRKLDYLTGTVNTAGSTIRHTDADGFQRTYTYDSAEGKYLNKDGSGAYDALIYNSGTHRWTRTDGDTQFAESYDASLSAGEWRITDQTDPDGNTVGYSYDAQGLIDEITNPNGDLVHLAYNANRQLLSVRTTVDGTSTTRVYYTYDAQGRLSQVKTDLTPTDGSIADGDFYSTTYTYDNTSTRITSIVNSDGTQASFTYDTEGRVQTLTDGVGKTTTLTYTTTTHMDQETANSNTAVLSTTLTQAANFNLSSVSLTTPALAWSTEALFADSPTTSATSPQIVFDQNGNGLAIWVLGTDLFYSTYTKSTNTWGLATALDGSLTGSPTMPHLSMSTNGNALVTWVQNTNIYARRCIAGVWDGATTIPLLENFSNASTLPVGAINNAGNAVVAFLKGSNLFTNVYNGTAWLTDATNIDDKGTANTNAITLAPQVAIDLSGNASVLWLQKQTSANAYVDLYSTRYTVSNNTWTNPSNTVLETGTSTITATQIAFDASGNGLAVWLQDTNLYARKYTASSNTWAAATTLSTTASGTPSLSVSSNGNALVAWLQSGSVYARRYSVDAWIDSAAELVESASGTAYNPVGRINDAGQAAIAFVQTSGPVNNVYTSVCTAGTWSGSTNPIESNANSIATTTIPSLAINNSGEISVLWLQKNGTQTTNSIYRNCYAAAAPYFTIPTGATWSSIAATLYGSATVASALQTALGNPSLIAGNTLTNLPATLAGTTTTTVSPYYTVQSGDTWATITQAIYGTSEANAIAALQASLGNPALTVGAMLTVPASFSFNRIVTLGVVTTVTDPLGQTSTLTSDAAGNLTRLQGPVGSAQDIRYTYNTRGDVTSFTDSRGNTTQNTYDSHGNLTRQQDAAGNVLERSYNSANQLISQTVYAQADPDGAGILQASVPQTTHYIYDPEQHLRFTVSPEGRVVEHRYNTAGQAIASLAYSGGTYTAATYEESDLLTWTVSQDLTQLERTDTIYDLRGLISSVTSYAATDTSGAGITDGTQSTTRYVHDAFGRLLQKIDPRGVATTGIANDYLTSYAYDGLGRILSVRLPKRYWLICSARIKPFMSPSNPRCAMRSSTTAHGMICMIEKLGRRSRITSAIAKVPLMAIWRSIG